MSKCGTDFYERLNVERDTRCRFFICNQIEDIRCGRNVTSQPVDFTNLSLFFEQLKPELDSTKTLTYDIFTCS